MFLYVCKQTFYISRASISQKVIYYKPLRPLIKKLTLYKRIFFFQKETKIEIFRRNSKLNFLEETKNETLGGNQKWNFRRKPNLTFRRKPKWSFRRKPKTVEGNQIFKEGSHKKLFERKACFYYFDLIKYNYKIISILFIVSLF